MQIIIPKGIVPWLIAICGALGILKTIVEFTQSTIEHGNSLIGIFYCIGVATVVFYISYPLCGMPIAFVLVILEYFLPKLNPVKYVWVATIIPAVIVTILNSVGRFGSNHMLTRPTSVEALSNFGVLFFVIVGAAVILGGCFMIYLYIAKVAEERASHE